jgi:hypothetical protein
MTYLACYLELREHATAAPLNFTDAEHDELDALWWLMSDEERAVAAWISRPENAAVVAALADA